MGHRAFKLPRRDARPAKLTCAFCSRPSTDRHVCDHGAPCGTSCERCVEVDLFVSDSDGRIKARRRGLFEVELELAATVPARVFRRIMAAMQEDWTT